MAHFASYNTSDTNATQMGVAPLQANATKTVSITSGQESKVVGICISDQPGSFVVQQSFDGVNWDYSSSAYNVTAGTGVKFSEDVIAPNCQILYTNGGTNQGYLRLFARATGNRSG